MFKVIVLICSLVPLCCHVPYLIQAWSSSRLDQWDWVFYLLCALAVYPAVRGRKFGKYDWTALFLLIPMLLLTCSGRIHHINALSVASGAGVIWSTVWLFGGWNYAFLLLPAAVLLLLGTPSSSYHISLLLMCPVWLAWGIKLLLAFLCFGWILLNRKFGWVIRKGELLFTAAALGTALLLVHTKELYFRGESFIPEFRIRSGEFFGRTILPDENTKRFFATSKVRQYRYMGKNHDISVLSVLCGKNIHEIHPASHCLRTSYWTIYSEKLLYLRDNFAVTEIDAQKGSSRMLVWVWFSSRNFSTPSFLGFRRHFNHGEDHYTYQISVPVMEGRIESGREILRTFLGSFRKEIQK